MKFPLYIFSCLISFSLVCFVLHILLSVEKERGEFLWLVREGLEDLTLEFFLGRLPRLVFLFEWERKDRRRKVLEAEEIV